MMEWFPGEDVFRTRHKHHVIVVPVTTDYIIPDTPLKCRLMCKYPDVVRKMQEEMPKSQCATQCYCVSVKRDHVRILFIPVLRKNPQSGIICPDLRKLELSMAHFRHCSLVHHKLIAFDKYSFFSWDKEEEMAYNDCDRNRLWPYVENAIRRWLGGDEYIHVGLFVYKGRN